MAVFPLKAKTYKISYDDLGVASFAPDEKSTHVIDSQMGDDRDIPLLVKP